MLSRFVSIRHKNVTKLVTRVYKAVVMKNVYNALNNNTKLKVTAQILWL